MVAKNDITGDALRSKSSSQNYRDGWDRIFGKKEHDLYKTGDVDAPNDILDRNGEVVLTLCRVCGGAEGSLATECPGVQLTFNQLNDIYNGVNDFKNGKWEV